MTGSTSLVMNQRQTRSGDKMCDDHPHDYSNLIYLMSCNKGGPDSHLVPDEDDFRFTDDHNHHHLQVAPKVTKAHLFDLNRDLNDALNDDTALSTIVMINSKAEEDADEDVVVPHDSRLPASNQSPPNEADSPALVPSLSVCSNHLPCDQDGDEQVSERTLTSTPPNRNKGPPTTNKRKRRAKVDKKLKALQGLIPNCTHKVDRASILDEAIVYVKTLQLQLQMMTMPFPMIGIPPPFIAPPLILPHHHHPFPTFPCIQSSTHLPASSNYNVNSV